MSNNTIFRSVLVIATAVVAIVVGSNYFALERAKVDRAADIEKTEIERDKSVKLEQQKTERTEERSHFWQKLVPWGTDETEENVNQ